MKTTSFIECLIESLKDKRIILYKCYYNNENFVLSLRDQNSFLPTISVIAKIMNVNFHDFGGDEGLGISLLIEFDNKQWTLVTEINEKFQLTD